MEVGLGRPAGPPPGAVPGMKSAGEGLASLQVELRCKAKGRGPGRDLSSFPAPDSLPQRPKGLELSPRNSCPTLRIPECGRGHNRPPLGLSPGQGARSGAALQPTLLVCSLGWTRPAGQLVSGARPRPGTLPGAGGADPSCHPLPPAKSNPHQRWNFRNSKGKSPSVARLPEKPYLPVEPRPQGLFSWGLSFSPPPAPPATPALLPLRIPATFSLTRVRAGCRWQGWLRTMKKWSPGSETMKKFKTLARV